MFLAMFDFSVKEKKMQSIENPYNIIPDIYLIFFNVVSVFVSLS